MVFTNVIAYTIGEDTNVIGFRFGEKYKCIFSDNDTGDSICYVYNINMHSYLDRVFLLTLSCCFDRRYLQNIFY